MRFGISVGNAHIPIPGLGILTEKQMLIEGSGLCFLGMLDMGFMK